MNENIVEAFCVKKLSVNCYRRKLTMENECEPIVLNKKLLKLEASLENVTKIIMSKYLSTILAVSLALLPFQQACEGRSGVSVSSSRSASFSRSSPSTYSRPSSVSSRPSYSGSQSSYSRPASASSRPSYSSTQSRPSSSSRSNSLPNSKFSTLYIRACIH